MKKNSLKSNVPAILGPQLPSLLCKSFLWRGLNLTVDQLIHPKMFPPRVTTKTQHGQGNDNGLSSPNLTGDMAFSFELALSVDFQQLATSYNPLRTAQNQISNHSLEFLLEIDWKFVINHCRYIVQYMNTIQINIVFNIIIFY